MFHHVVLKLARVLESLLALSTPVQGGTAMNGQVPLQLSQCGEIQTTLHTNVLLSFLMFQLMGAKLTRVRKTSAAHIAAVRLDVTVLHHVSLQVAGLSEGLVAHLALVGPHALVGKQVCVQVTQLLKKFPTQVTSMRLDAVVPQDMCNQVVLGGVGLFTHTTLPSLLVSTHIYIITIVHMDVETELFSTGRPTARRSVTAAMTRAGVLSWIERTSGEVHDWAGHEEGVWKEAVVERWEVGRVEEERRGRPHRGRAERLLLHLHR